MSPQEDNFVAPAKINLTLEVIAKRADGYHDINTLFYRVAEPHDVLSVSKSETFRLTCNDPSIPTGEKNLIWRAVHRFALEAAIGIPNIHIHLQKGIPTGAGLGGGSSNAATTLLMLNESSERGLSHAQLSTIAATLGADVPFFLAGWQTALGTGIGDQLEEVQFSIPFPILIAKHPGISVNTKEAYENLALRQNVVPTDLKEISLKGITLRGLGQFRNDFEPGVFARDPMLLEMRSAMKQAGAMYAAMTGSGSALFGIFSTESDAREAEGVLIGLGASCFYNPPASAKTSPGSQPSE